MRTEQKIMAYAKKDTFWNKQRVDKGLTTKEISEITGINEKNISAYFTGFLMPNEQTIRILCDLFDVDFRTGNLEFQHAHRQYKGEHNITAKYSSKKKKSGQIDTVEDVLERLYGTLSCSEFIAIYCVLTGTADETINPLKILYHKIDDYETYEKITQIIKGKED